MIDDSILDEIIPAPTLDELKEEKIQELSDEGFVITNFNPGGVWYTLLMIVLLIKVELTQLLRTVLSNMFLLTASGTWLLLKAKDYSVNQKAATKTRGNVTISRDTGGEAVKIPKGYVFKTEEDINGEQLRYFVVADTVLQKGATSVDILAEAENEGARYNVPAGQITQSLTYLGGGVNKITNGASWITSEGADIEDVESVRTRALRSWSELAARSIKATYQNTCEAISGVLFADVDDEHPRGQGTIDIIITGTAGAASDGLLDTVRTEVNKIIGPYDNVLVKSSETVAQDVAVTITIPSDIDDTGIDKNAETIITKLLAIRKDRKLNELLGADIIYAIKNGIGTAIARNVKVTIPADDVTLPKGQIIILGNVTVTVQKDVA